MTSKKNPYKVGDRVYWYDALGNRHSMVVEDINGDGVVSNTLQITSHWRYFKGRLTKPKPRREIWVNEYAVKYGSFSYSIHSTKEYADREATSTRLSCTHFREVRREKGGKK